MNQMFHRASLLKEQLLNNEYDVIHVNVEYLKYDDLMRELENKVIFVVFDGTTPRVKYDKYKHHIKNLIKINKHELTMILLYGLNCGMEINNLVCDAFANITHVELNDSTIKYPLLKTRLDQLVSRTKNVKYKKLFIDLSKKDKTEIINHDDKKFWSYILRPINANSLTNHENLKRLIKKLSHSRSNNYQYKIACIYNGWLHVRMILGFANIKADVHFKFV